ncbi:MAG: beta-ketoacyl-ACP synthase II [Candidatus Hydrogenedens sp.]|nr:beta-ketoacyl-ACP synthase II [Candidatus Hydrogenedens sp.]
MRIVVTGMGVVSPLGNDIAQFWSAVCSGKSGIRTVSEYDPSMQITRFGGIAETPKVHGLSPEDLAARSRYMLLAMAAADQAWKQSGLDLSEADPYRYGTYLGASMADLEAYANAFQALFDEGPRAMPKLTAPAVLKNVPAGILASRHGCKGPNKAIVSACASGSHAIGDAAMLIRAGRADAMLAVSTEAPIFPATFAMFNALNALSTRNEAPESASRPFDLERDGFVLAEGAGAMVLESEAHAQERGAEILAELAGYGQTCDAYHIFRPDPTGAGAAACMRQALRDAEADPDDVGYINAHATGTPMGDRAEALAIQQVFPEAQPWVSSTKAILGHLAAAAGAVEAIVAALAVRYGVVPPQMNCDHPDPECAIRLAPAYKTEGRIDLALSNSFGFGGTNAVLAFRPYPR